MCVAVCDAVCAIAFSMCVHTRYPRATTSSHAILEELLLRSGEVLQNVRCGCI